MIYKNQKAKRWTLYVKLFQANVKVKSLLNQVYNENQ